MTPFDRESFAGFIRCTLAYVDPALLSDSAVNLLLGTCAVESDFGTFRVQHGGGPARGVFQMEPKTQDWLRVTFEKKYPVLSGTGPMDLERDLFLAVIFARLRYRVDSKPLPDANDVPALAATWKRIYNSILGTGTVEDFIEKYNKYVMT